MTQQPAGAEQVNEQPKLRGKPWKPGQSGNPSGSTKSKRYLELYADIVNDIGGEGGLSGIDRCLAAQVVGLLIRGEKAGDADEAVRCANSAARLLTSLRKRKREPTGPTLEEHIAQLAREHTADVAVDDEDSATDAESQGAS